GQFADIDAGLDEFGRDAQAFGGCVGEHEGAGICGNRCEETLRDVGCEFEATAFNQVKGGLAGGGRFRYDPVDLGEFLVTDVVVDVDEMFLAGNLVGGCADALPGGGVDG